MSLPRRRAPLWFVVVLAVLAGLAARAWLAPLADAAPGGPPARAFWPLFVLVVEYVWKGIEVAGQVTLKVLAFAVHYLWLFAKAIGGLFREFAELAVKGARQTWRFFRWTYESVLKPAWQKFWKFVDDTKNALKRIGQPVFDFLHWVRAHVLAFYDRFVRPVLDFIGLTRQVLHVLQAFGLDWARRLDHALADLEAAIDRPFRLLLAEINKVINVVNRVVTADGLFQRLALVQSIARDYKQVWDQLGDGYRRGMTADKRAALVAGGAGKSLAAVRAELAEQLTTHSGAAAELATVAAPAWRAALPRSAR